MPARTVNATTANIAYQATNGCTINLTGSGSVWAGDNFTISGQAGPLSDGRYALIVNFQAPFVFFNSIVSLNGQLQPSASGTIVSGGSAMVFASAQVPSTVMNGPVQISFQIANSSGVQCSGSYTLYVKSCNAKAGKYDGNLLAASKEGNNCFIANIPTSIQSKVWIWNKGFYISPDLQCPSFTTSDTANCLFKQVPSTGFIQNNKFYVKRKFANWSWRCPQGIWDSTGCLVETAPFGTTAFAYNGNWYTTPISKNCNQYFSAGIAKFDGANCYIMTVPVGATPLISNAKYYYIP